MSSIVPPGLHLIVDIESRVNLSDAVAIEHCLREAAQVCGARILNSCVHHFGEHAGVTGVVVLAESHISIHTWPELRYAAVDLFMCGSCDPYRALPVLSKHFATDLMHVRALTRTSPKMDQPLRAWGDKCA